MKVAVILASSRSHGNTGQLARHFAEQTQAKLFDVADYHITPFDYQFANRDDDFYPLMAELLAYDALFFASPMYWYAPSAQMKTFMDRLSDLLINDKVKGRLLRGKVAGLLATGATAQPASCFEQVFALTFDYLGLQYAGMLYCDCSHGFAKQQHQLGLKQYVNGLQNNKSLATTG